MDNLLNEYTPEEVEATGNQMYGGKRHDLICDELEKSGYKEEEINLISVGIWKGIESERRVQEEKLLSLNKKIESLQQEVEWLYDLEAAGVDNWSGIDEAYRLKRERLGEEDEE